MAGLLCYVTPYPCADIAATWCYKVKSSRAMLWPQFPEGVQQHTQLAIYANSLPAPGEAAISLGEET